MEQTVSEFHVKLFVLKIYRLDRSQLHKMLQEHCNESDKCDEDAVQMPFTESEVNLHVVIAERTSMFSTLHEG